MGNNENDGKIKMGMLDSVFQCSIDDFITKIKDSTFFRTYEAYVMEQKGNSNELLGYILSTMSNMDKEIGMIFVNLATDIFVGILDQKLRHEILNGEEWKL